MESTQLRRGLTGSSKIYSRRDVVPDELDALLVQWARWARGKHANRDFLVQCRSIEHTYLPVAGEVFSSVEDSLRASIGPTAALPVSDVVRTEIAVMRLPERHRRALRLEYVTYKKLPLVAKRRLLGADEGEYWALIGKAASLVALILDS